jgi:UPF0755 protein
MKVVKIISLLLGLAVVAALGLSFWLFRSLNAPIAHDKTAQFITVEKGSSPREVLNKLSTEGILEGTMPTLIYLRLFGDASKLQAGDYQFSSPISPMQVLKELEKGESQTTKLVIPEGFTRFDIAKRISEKFPQDPPMSELAVLTLMDDVTLIKDIAPNAKNLEGYMYPSTYSFPPTATPKEIIRGTVEQFKKTWKTEWNDAAKRLGRTPEEIVTIASLSETETGVESERPIVASVIYNRLNKGIPLGIDQTNVYLAKMMGRWDGTIHKSDLEVASPYNTRKYSGIPPGPISSVSESSIRAALNPDNTNYIFYVKNVDVHDGSHWFYASAAEFEKGKAKYQAWLATQR